MCADVPTSPRTRRVSSSARPRRPRQLRVAERQDELAPALRRPLGLEPPLAGHLGEIRLRRRGPLDVDGDRRLAIDAVVHAAQPAVPPADHLGHVIDPGTGDRGVREHVAPGTHQEPLRHAEMLERAQHRGAVHVRPARHQHRGDLDQVVVGTQRALAPERPVRLLLDRAEPRLQLVDPSEPPVAPVVPGERRHRRQGVHRHHEERVAELDRLADAAAEVDVVRVAVVGGVDRHDRLQGRRPPHRGLDRVEPGVRGPVHPHRAGAPVRAREPVDHLGEVLHLLRRVLVDRDALGRAGAAHVQAADRVVPLVAEAPVLARPHREVVLAVGIGLEQGGPRPARLAAGRGSPPDARRPAWG